VACGRDVSRLDDVQKMAYAVKPAVVRVNAFATADFHYSAADIARTESQLSSDGYVVRARAVAADQNDVQTGAGGSGSGFIIHPDGFILTSGHVVAPTRDEKALEADLRRNGAIAALVRHFPVDTLRAIHRDEALDRYVQPLARVSRIDNLKVVNSVELSNGETLPFRIRRYSPALTERGSDLAVLRIERKGLPALPLGTSDETRVGESIWSVGYPAVASSTDEVIGGWLSRDSDLEATINPGNITAIKRNVTNAPVFQTNVAIYRGNSGGPAVNRAGQAIGVSTWGHTDAEQIKFLVPIDVARQFLAEASVTPKSDGEFNDRYYAALNAASNGRWVDAKKDLARAVVLFPNSPDLIRFSRDADRAIAAMPPWRLYPIATALIAALALAALAVATFLFVRSRGPRVPIDILKAATIETVVAPNGTMAAHAMLGKFTILNGTRAGEKLGLGGSGIRIGRESAICEIVLENPKVSRLHAEVVSIDGKVLLIDRNSSNGTYVNDQKIDKRYLQDGDIIYFGGRNAVAVAFHA
jgi:S1-C subfamily serine protease